MSSDNCTDKLTLELGLIGRVIAQATSIESMINAYITEFYTRCPKANYQATYLAFMFDVMNDRGISLDTKINILAKIYERMHGNSGKLNRTLFSNWLKIRNIFAHGTHIADKGILYSGDFFDVEEQAKKHAELQIKINAELERAADLRGPYFNQFPTKEQKK